MSARRPHRTAMLPKAGRFAAAAATAMLCSCAATGGLPKSQPTASADGFARVTAPAVMSQPGTARAASGVMPVAYESSAAGRPVSDFTPSEGRMPVLMADGSVCPGTCPTGCPDGAEFGGAAVGIAGVTPPRPDEFLCDGGDRTPPVHYDPNFRHGLDTEDTVAEWSDPAGGRHVTPSNKVCVYAPRYGEVRSFASPAGGVRVEQLVSANETTRGAGLDMRTGPDAEVQKTRLGGVRVRSRASGVEIENGLAGFDGMTAAALDVEDVQLLVNTAFVARGQLVRGEEAFLAKRTQSAIVWTRTLFPVVTANDNASQEMKAEFAPAELAGVEDRSKPGILRIVKLADKSAAASGEVVTFTIRYDNMGDKPVQHVRIVDNLTPRLALVEGSATSDRAGRLDVEPNGEGSVVLTFVVDDPLPGKTGGVVTFKATVR